MRLRHHVPRALNRRERALTAVAGVLATVLLGTYVARPSVPDLSGLSRGCPSSAPTLSILMVGNSYTDANNLPGMLAHVLCHGAPRSVEVQTFTAGGGTLSADVVNGVTRGLDAFDVVVVQEQSQTPGFGFGAAYEDSIDAVENLVVAAERAHTRVVFFETWGHHDGDPLNPGIYPDYEQMQRRISAGYAGYLAESREIDVHLARVATVGQDWSKVRGADRLLFDQLYQSDGSHPSIVGSYLAALVLAGTILGRPAGDTWVAPGVSLRQADILQRAAS